MYVIEEACRMVSKLDIQVKELVEVHIRKLATGVHDTRAEMARVQLEMIVQITKLKMKA